MIDEESAPSRAEVAAILERYFEPADAAVVDNLHVSISKLLTDPPRHRVVNASFHANGRRFFGQAWKEELSRGQTRPRVRDLIAWVAVTEPGNPAPLLYCPGQLVGRWHQTVPASASWRLGADATASIDDPELALVQRWCLHRHGDTGPAGDALWLYDSDGESHPLQIESVGQHLQLTLIDGKLQNVTYELVRD